MLTFEKATTPQQIESTAQLAKIIWNQHFITIISKEQIDFMLDKFQSAKAITNQISQGYEYYGFFEGGNQVGYFAFCEKPDNTLFLSKLYLSESCRGKGYASKAFEKIKNIATRNGNTMIWLTVNKGNDSSIAIYKHWGMEIIRSEVTDIDGGFVMDDYVFGYKI